MTEFLSSIDLQSFVLKGAMKFISWFCFATMTLLGRVGLLGVGDPSIPQTSTEEMYGWIV